MTSEIYTTKVFQFLEFDITLNDMFLTFMKIFGKLETTLVWIINM